MYKIMVESEDWKELQDALAEKERYITNIKKVLVSLLTEYERVCRVSSVDVRNAGAVEEVSKFV